MASNIHGIYVGNEKFYPSSSITPTYIGKILNTENTAEAPMMWNITMDKGGTKITNISGQSDLEKGKFLIIGQFYFKDQWGGAYWYIGVHGGGVTDSKIFDGRSTSGIVWIRVDTLTSKMIMGGVISLLISLFHKLFAWHPYESEVLCNG